MHHLTTGTFNYVVKDPDCIHLSGQLWIKDSPGQCRMCVLELGSAVFVLLAANTDRYERGSYLLHFGLWLLGFAPSFARVIQQRMTFCANFLRVSDRSSLVNQNLSFVD
ncbi:MAG: hypothetical protein NVSMB62_08640 [Acidobacteriaceae bacterium]